MVAKVTWHPGEFYPRVGLIVTNLSRLAERVVAFCNRRGTAEQWIVLQPAAEMRRKIENPPGQS